MTLSIMTLSTTIKTQVRNITLNTTEKYNTEHNNKNTTLSIMTISTTIKT